MQRPERNLNDVQMLPGHSRLAVTLEYVEANIDTLRRNLGAAFATRGAFKSDFTELVRRKRQIRAIFLQTVDRITCKKRKPVTESVGTEETRMMRQHYPGS